jgi:hypothetical protein
MDITTLEKANELNRKIKQFSEALNCFEMEPYCDGERNNVRVSTNPQIIIEYDGGDERELIKIPMALNEVLINFLLKEIKTGLDKTVEEFNAL